MPTKKYVEGGFRQSPKPPEDNKTIGLSKDSIKIISIQICNKKTDTEQLWWAERSAWTGSNLIGISVISLINLKIEGSSNRLCFL